MMPATSQLDKLISLVHGDQCAVLFQNDIGSGRSVGRRRTDP
jgi:hypothetical protein